MVIDLLGGVFSDLSLAFKENFDLIAASTYTLVIVRFFSISQKASRRVFVGDPETDSDCDLGHGCRGHYCSYDTESKGKATTKERGTACDLETFFVLLLFT